MPTTSMTGFGHGEAREGGVSATAELSTVNRRQFDCHVVLPKEIAVLEPQVQALLQKYIRRGDVKGSVALSLGAASEMTVDLPLAEARLAALRDAATKLGLRDDFSASALFLIPDAVRFAPPRRTPCRRRIRKKPAKTAPGILVKALAAPASAAAQGCPRMRSRTPESVRKRKSDSV